VNGAHCLLKTLNANNVTKCFANPGTSEMHFVAGLDDVPEVRAILCLFEGVATGAADGYARVTGRPAATLLHLGPGLANGWANLHNARRARVPLLNIVGDHATFHAKFDAPLQSDIATVAKALKGWLRSTQRPDDVANDTADAIGAAYGPPGQIATLILPSDVSWGEVTEPPAAWPLAARSGTAVPDDRAIVRALDVLRSKRAALIVGGSAMDATQLGLAQRVASASGTRLIMETFPPIMDHGAGVVNPERLIYLSEFSIAQLKEFDALVLIGAAAPVAFFAYPDIANIVAEGCELVNLAPPGTDTLAALSALVEGLRAPALSVDPGNCPSPPTGELTTRTFAAAVGATMPEDVVVVDESVSSGVDLLGATQFSPVHRWMQLTGGSMGYALPSAIGAAVGSGQRILALESDGAMMYTPQALWTMARENLDITVVGLSNRSYAILTLERKRVGAFTEGSTSQGLLDIDRPTIDLCALASAQGVPSIRVTSAEELVTALQRSYATPGPMFIEAVLPKRIF
jgi:acetolactate synthase-1/2/3 large subunit